MKNLPKRNTTNSAKQADSTQLDPWIIWVTIRRCWTWALPIGLILAMGTGYLVMQSFVPRFKANHILETNQDFVVFKGVVPVVKNLAKTEKPIVFHPVVLDPVLADPAIRKAPSLSNPETAELSLLKNISVTSGGTESRMVISYTDTDQEYAAKVCNAIVESYLNKRVEVDKQRVSTLERLLEPEIERWQGIVETKQTYVHELTRQTHGFNNSQHAVIENSDTHSLASRLRSEMVDLNLRVAIGEAEFALLPDPQAAEVVSKEELRAEVIDAEKLEPTQPTAIEIAKLVDQDEEVIKAKGRIQRYEKLVIDLEDQNRVGVRRTDYNQYKSQIEAWSGVLEKARTASREKVMGQLQEIVDRNFEVKVSEALSRRETAHLNKVKEYEEEKEALRKLKSQLQIVEGQYEVEKERLQQFGGATAKLQFAQGDLEAATSVLSKLRDRVAAIRTERDHISTVRTIAHATPPRAPVETVPYKKLAIVSLGALAIPFVLGLLLEIRTQRLTDCDMCDKNGLAVIGEIAKLPSKSRPGLSRRVFEESVDTLRSSLFLSLDTKDTRTVAVVSSMSGEGKSSVSCQLALSIAKSTGETVLLIDADLRCPDQHEIFGLDGDSGLADVLAEKKSLSESIDTSLGDLIHVLPAGNVSKSPHRLVSAERIRSLLEQARKEYQYVVIDTAPVLSAGETLAIAAEVDTTLLCVMRDVSRVENATRTKRRLEAVGATLGGTVFSGVTPRQYASRYGNYHYTDVHGISS